MLLSSNLVSRSLSGTCCSRLSCLAVCCRGFIACFGLCVYFCLSSLFLGDSAAQAQSWSPDGKFIALEGSALQLIDSSALNAFVSGPITSNPVTNPALAAPVSPPLSLISLPVLFSQPGSGTVSGPVWSRDGRTLAYIADGQKLIMLEMKDKKFRVLDTNAVSPAAWSRDSALFAVVHQNEKGGLQARIRYRNGQTFLPPITLPFNVVPSAFPPVRFLTNTTNIIVAGGDGGKNDLYLLDQGEVVRLTSTGDILGFAVSADGTRLRWVRASPNTHYILLQIYEMNIDTRTLRKLPFPDRLPAINPDPRHAPSSISSVIFAPGMDSFAFIVRGGPQTAANGSALWITDITGRAVHFVGSGVSIGGMSGGVNGSSGVQPTPAATSMTAVTSLTFPAFPPTFSPDGRTLTALHIENGKRFLFVANPATGQGKDIPLP